MEIRGTGLGCGVYRINEINATSTSKDIEKVLSGIKYNGRFCGAFVYTIVSPTWKKTIAALTKYGFKVAVKNKTAIIMLKPTGKRKK